MTRTLESVQQSSLATFSHALSDAEPVRLTALERAKAFSQRFPKYAPLVVHNDRLFGTWIIGSVFGHKTVYYGEYPYKVRERIEALFPDARSILHLFSGIIVDDPPRVMTWDIKSELHPTVCDDVRNLARHADLLSSVDLVMADPPYEKDDFAKYGCVPFDKFRIIRELGGLMKSGSHLAWLDLRIPMYDRKIWSLLGHVGMVVGTNTRARMLTLWERV